MRWLPVETAPKDGRTVFIWYAGECMRAAYLGVDHGRTPQWYVLRGFSWEAIPDPPAHWMPLPLPPPTPGT